jgi:LDH2 family malate/lactate/ureidoglycolate dehydrogenase
MPIMQAEQVRSMTEMMFQAAGAPETTAATLADAIVLAHLRGYDTHGVRMIPNYVRSIRGGRLDPTAEPAVIGGHAATALVDGKHGFGQLAGRFATDLAVARAKEYGAAAVGVIRCNHTGRLGEYPERAARQGVLALATCGSVGRNRGARQAPYGGRESVMSTNPIAIGVPAGAHAPIVVDFATTVVSGGKVELARAMGTELPPGAILDKQGRPSVNPNDVSEGGTMLPVGGHKGFGLALVAACLAQGLTGELDLAGQPSGLGMFVWAVDASAFAPAADYGRRIDWMIDQVTAVPPAEGFTEVLVPGERAQREQQRRAAEGIPVAPATWEAVRRTATELGVDDRLPAVS